MVGTEVTDFTIEDENTPSDRGRAISTMESFGSPI